MPRWWKGCLLVSLFLVCVSCGGGKLTGADPALEQGKRSAESGGVPQLKKLIGQDGFRQKVEKVPNLLGYSYDGTYIATMVYDLEAEAYRIDLFHTGTNRLEETVYAPLQKEGESIQEKEMLALTQETLDLGYRIRVPATPRTQAVTRPIETGGKTSYTLSIKQQDDEVILTAAQGKDRWELTRFHLGDSEQLASRWMISSPPSPGERWTVIAAADSDEQGLRPLVHTLDLSFLAEGWTEQALKERRETLFDEEARIAFRGNTTDREGPKVLLVVQGEDAKDAAAREGIRYRGTVDRFVILDEERKVKYRGNGAGLVRDESVRLAPELPIEPDTRFRLLLTEEEGEGKPDLTLTVDQLDPSGDIIQTYELIWNPEKHRFQIRGDA